MLDYIKNENEDQSQQQQQGSLQEALSENDNLGQAEDQDLQQDVGEDEFFTTSVEKTSVKRNTMILVALFVVGAVSIFLMVKNTGPSSAGAATANAAANNEIEIAIAKLSGIKAEIFEKMDGIAKKFDEISNIEQIGVASLQRNPFSLQPAISSRIGNSGIGSKSTVGKYLRLESVIESSDGNICMIDGRIYRQGDRLGSYVVTEVARDMVRLTSEGSERILKID